MESRLKIFEIGMLAVVVFYIAGVSRLSAEEIPLNAGQTLRINTHTGYRNNTINRSASEAYIKPKAGSEMHPSVYESRMDVQATINRIYSSASINFGKVVDGKTDDTDFEFMENPSGERSHDDLMNDVRDLCIGLGYQIDFFDNRLKVAPLAGLSYHTQQIRGAEGIPAEADGAPNVYKNGQAVDPLYESEWRGWFLGLDMNVEVAKDTFVSSSLAYHNAELQTSSIWANTPESLPTKRSMHETTGEGAVVNISVNRTFAKRWLIGLMYGWEDWSAGSGEELFTDFQKKEKTSTSEPGKWNAQSINLSIGYNF